MMNEKHAEQALALLLHHAAACSLDVDQLYAFAKESNRIEGIEDAEQDHRHAKALASFIQVRHLTQKELVHFTKMLDSKIYLRTKSEHRVFIAGHAAPSAKIVGIELPKLLQQINHGPIDPLQAHIRYEYLHPFIDGNGRSGRAVWLWQMVHQHHWRCQLPFLHKFYYQSLNLLTAPMRGQHVDLTT